MQAYKDAVALHAKAAGLKPQEGPCTHAITAALPFPVSWSEKPKEGPLKHVSKPDWDNLGKVICDAMNSIAWIDDAQVY